MSRRNKKDKKKKSTIKRIFKGIGILLLLIIAALVLIPYFFKDQLKDMALQEANKMLTADVAVGDFDLTVFSTFPKMNLEFDSVSVTGREKFKGIKLADIKELDVRLDFWSVISMDNITVRSIRLVKPKIHVMVLPDGTANYNIMKSEEEVKKEDTTSEKSSPFAFKLSNYEIKDGTVIYDDQQSPMYAEITELNHKGSLDIKKSGEEIDLATTTSMKDLTYKMDGMTYLNKVKTNLDMKLKMEFKKGSKKFTLADNELSLNNLKLSFAGFYQLFDDYSTMDLKLKAGNTSFKDLLSLIPAFYKTGYEKMVTKGSLNMGGFVKGKLADNSYPAWDFNLNVSNASIKYPAMPSTIDNINIVAGSKFPGGANLDALTVSVPKLSAKFVGNTIDADFFMKNRMTDPYMKTKINANVDLASIGKVYPLGGKEDLNGKLSANIAFEGRYSTIEKGEYDKVNAKGGLKLDNAHYASPDMPAPVDIKTMEFDFSPKALKLVNLEAKMGKSDFKMNGNVENYIAYLFKKGDLKGDFNYHSNVLDVDELYPSTTAKTETSENNDSKNTEAKSGQSAEEPIAVPDKIDFNLKTTIDKVIYDGMNIEDVKGNVRLKDQVADLSNLSMKTMGGTVAISGKYNTQNPKTPKLEFSYSLKHLNIKELAKNFNTIDKLAPIAKYVDGFVSSDFTMNTSLQPSLEPIYNTLNGKGSLFSSQVTIAGFKPLDKLADVIKIDKLKKQTLQNIRTHFTFENGKVRVKPFDIKMGDIKTNVSGTTSFKQDIDYKLQMNIPKDKIPSKIMDVAEKAVSKLKNIPGFKMKELPNEIPISAFITNTINDPKIKTNLKEKLMELGGNVKGQVKDLVEDKIKEAKDTVKKVIQEKKEDVNKELEKQKKMIIDDAQKQADNVVAEAKKLANQTRAEANKNAQKLINDAGNNPLKKAGAKVAAKKVREQGEKTAKGIESKAKQQADNIMKTAKEKAANLKLK